MAEDTSSIELEKAIDILYQVQRSDFVTARNSLVRELKKARTPEDARRVQGLKKPNLPAWSINQLFWSSTEIFASLMTAGDRVRDVQNSKVRGAGRDDLNRAIEQRRRALRDAQRTAESYLLQIQQPVTAATSKRIENTLETAALFGSDPAQPVDGRLENDLDPPGFEALMAFAASSSLPRSAPPAAKKNDPEKQTPAVQPANSQLEQARLAIRTSAQAVTAAKSVREQSEAKVASAGHKVQRVRAAIGSLETEISKLRRDLKAAQKELAVTTAHREKLVADESAATRRFESAKSKLEKLEELTPKTAPKT